MHIGADKHRISLPCHFHAMYSPLQEQILPCPNVHWYTKPPSVHIVWDLEQKLLHLAISSTEEINYSTMAIMYLLLFLCTSMGGTVIRYSGWEKIRYYKMCKDGASKDFKRYISNLRQTSQVTMLQTETMDCPSTTDSNKISLLSTASREHSQA